MSETCDGRHMCEPPYPVTEGSTWDCPECGRRSYACRIGDIPNIDRFLSESMRRHVNLDDYGWTSRPTFAEVALAEPTPERRARMLAAKPARYTRPEGVEGIF